MIESLIVGGAALSVYLSQKFVRSYWFHRQRYEKRSMALDLAPERTVMMPVDGTIVYVKKVKGGRVTTTKKGREIAHNWVGEQDGYLIGIYMCVYDRHFIANPVTDRISVRHIKAKANIPMMDLWEYINFYYVGRFVDWFEEKAFNYKLQNEKVIYDYHNGMSLMGIADKFVNKIEIPSEIGNYKEVEQGTKIGHIKRGSQVDIFIPEELFVDWAHGIKEGKKVKVGDFLCLLKHKNHSES